MNTNLIDCGEHVLQEVLATLELIEEVEKALGELEILLEVELLHEIHPEQVETGEDPAAAGGSLEAQTIRP